MTYNLKEMMKIKGIGNKELAEKAGIPLGTLNKIIYGDTSNPTLSNMQAIAHALDCTLDDFVNDEEHSKKFAERISCYYYNIEAERVAREMYERPELKVLFDASRNVDADDVIQVSKILEKLQKQEEGNGDDI